MTKSYKVSITECNGDWKKDMFKAHPLLFSGDHRPSEKPTVQAFVPFLLALTLVYIFLLSVFLS